MMDALRSDLREVRGAALWGYNRSSDPTQPTLAALVGKAGKVVLLAAGTAYASKKVLENPQHRTIALPAVALATKTFSETSSFVDEVHDFANLIRFNREER